MVVEREDELVDLVNRGFKLRYDSRNNRWKIEDPETRRSMLVSKQLNGLAEALYRKQMEGRRKRLRDADGVFISSDVLKEDMKFMIELLRQRLDPKSPILAKLVEDEAWGFHVRLDFSRQATPEIWQLMNADEIDLKNPEVTARNMISKLKELKEAYLRIGRVEEEVKNVESKYRSEIESLKLENAKLREIIGEYRRLVGETVEEMRKIMGDLGEKVKETYIFFTAVIPQSLPEDTRSTYKYIASSKLKQIWGG
jgi:regulator of replication initiation timing